MFRNINCHKQDATYIWIHISGYKVKQKGHTEHLLDTPDPDDDDGDGDGEDEDHCDPHRLVKKRCLNL